MYIWFTWKLFLPFISFASMTPLRWISYDLNKSRTGWRQGCSLFDPRPAINSSVVSLLSWSWRRCDMRIKKSGKVIWRWSTDTYWTVFSTKVSKAEIFWRWDNVKSNIIYMCTKEDQSWIRHGIRYTTLLTHKLDFINSFLGWDYRKESPIMSFENFLTKWILNWISLSNTWTV